MNQKIEKVDNSSDDKQSQRKGSFETSVPVVELDSMNPSCFLKVQEGVTFEDSKGQIMLGKKTSHVGHLSLNDYQSMNDLDVTSHLAAQRIKEKNISEDPFSKIRKQNEQKM